MTDLIDCLLEALEDEYKAEATYIAVLDRFGDVRPFSNIVQAENRHSSAIAAQLRRLEHGVPANEYIGRVTVPATLQEACSAAIEAEVENIAMYDRLLPRVSDAQVRRVFENLQAASRDNHLPAFRRCAERANRAGSSGRGARHGRGRGRD